VNVNMDIHDSVSARRATLEEIVMIVGDAT
jgi:hypothetical protein